MADAGTPCSRDAVAVMHPRTETEFSEGVLAYLFCGDALDKDRRKLWKRPKRTATSALSAAPKNHMTSSAA